MKDLPGADKVIITLKEIGVDISEKERTRLTPEILSVAGKVIVMAESRTIPDYLKERNDAIYWEVEDPKEMDQKETSKIRDQIKNLVEEFVTTL